MFAAARRCWQALARPSYAARSSPIARHMSTEAHQSTEQASKLDVRGILLFSIPVLATAGLGCWQWSRKGWKEELISLRKERLREAPVPAPDTYPDDDTREALQYRRLAVQGVYDHSKTMLVGPRQYDGKNGYHVITPLRSKNGVVVLVNRGWIPKQVAQDEAAMKALEVTGPQSVSGVAVIPQVPSSYVPANKPEENRWVAIRMGEMAAWVGAPSVPLMLELFQSGPASRPTTRLELPLPREAAELVQTYVTPEGHQVYALTWWCLSAALAGLTYKRFTRTLPKPRL